MIKTIVTAAGALLLMPGAVAAQGMSGQNMSGQDMSAQDRGAPPVVMPYPSQGMQPPMAPLNAGPMGYSTPMSDYQRPGYGYTLPRQWIAPSYYLGDFDAFDLPVPAAGFGWSRYYDDAVLTDQWGRVYDVRYDFERGARRHPRHRDDRYADAPMQPHWDMGYFDGHGTSDGYGYASAMSADCGCGETVTTTTTRTLPSTRPVTYRTVSYETVRTAAPRRLTGGVVRTAPRGKYVRTAR